MLVTGRYFDHQRPDPDAISWEALVAGLEILRFGGQTIRKITVAEHMLRVARIAELIARRDKGFSYGLRRSELRLFALMHDAHEALTPWGDCTRPGKTDAMRAVEDAIDVAIYTRFNARRPSPDVRAIVKQADNLALYFEALLWQPGSPDWAPRPELPEFMIAEAMNLVWPRPRESWLVQAEEAVRLVRDGL